MSETNGEARVMTPGKHRSISILVLAEILAMSVWFTSSAVLGDMNQEVQIDPWRQALLASGVQLGFAAGALGYAIFGLADKYDPRHVFAMSGLIAALANLGLIFAPIGSLFAISLRLLTGIFLAGVYPVGMKIAVSWGQQDRGLLVGLLVGALTLGSAAPHLLAFFGGADWRAAVCFASLFALIGAGLVLFSALGPFYSRATHFSAKTLKMAWQHPSMRRVFIGYLGHMWELYAFWAWIGIALGAAFSVQDPGSTHQDMAKLIAFGAVAIGAIACVIAGHFGDRIGKAKITILAMSGSAISALLAALVFSGPPALLIIVVLFWGATIIADSAQFSALIADIAPAQHVGSLMTLQTALGFGLTVVTVQLTPWLAEMAGWPAVFIVLAIGPLIGIVAMRSLLGAGVHTQEI